MTNHKEPNRRINEKSSYLLQHGHNPVDWYPWGEDAFTKVQAENKPKFYPSVIRLVIDGMFA
ncbi:uncharacterized protein DUF255 [Fontibacillus phaseoli]|uniref:Uncharacterized protein DUF255 n=1 Tax=Fontibacillus phaseoli TaxID=1416533 RepID=A0A369BUP1_9BACL|nr:uncharacterized protein DUF255 [Fontibacillus phaseoli]